MARDHARMQTALWRVEDWNQLTVAAQHAYQMLCQQPHLSYCGHLTYAPATLADLASDLTEAKVRRAVKELEAGRWVLTDAKTHELLIRTYVRHDGVLDRSNMGHAVGTAWERVVSEHLRHAVAHEMGRHMREHPELAGWVGLRKASPMAWDMACAMAQGME